MLSTALLKESFIPRRVSWFSIWGEISSPVGETDQIKTLERVIWGDDLQFPRYQYLCSCTLFSCTLFYWMAPELSLCCDLHESMCLVSPHRSFWSSLANQYTYNIRWSPPTFNEAVLFILGVMPDRENKLCMVNCLHVVDLTTSCSASVASGAVTERCEFVTCWCHFMSACSSFALNYL